MTGLLPKEPPYKLPTCERRKPKGCFLKSNCFNIQKLLLLESKGERVCTRFAAKLGSVVHALLALEV